MMRSDREDSRELQAALTAWAEGDGLLGTPFKRVLFGQEAAAAGRALIEACADKTTWEKRLLVNAEDIQAGR
ncbi:hypothetical protein GZ176_11915 [Dermatophilus congolensis]|uniref:hypothetical protein n=1 Tax=Dermatophilus congolensis TaxID=1863 RepID=UPI001AAEFCC6|nr:hypothetical protein [Dermatophilus congolensis]MBO3146374.1 hypothetical protein [Dermatophilus congolensis]MBO3148583.1 hypothetical protein [Dermatophilus congolensis]MBO3157566.1 hypothetical protein [Dermatophilus congolensis]MBO3159903.1 hypothetical protein [Dermatophilus congolensis]MBO3166642.1 hypothetical protein [Dermatophilus congolensis]